MPVSPRWKPQLEQTRTGSASPEPVRAAHAVCNIWCLSVSAPEAKIEPSARRRMSCTQARHAQRQSRKDTL